MRVGLQHFQVGYVHFGMMEHRLEALTLREIGGILQDPQIFTISLIGCTSNTILTMWAISGGQTQRLQVCLYAVLKIKVRHKRKASKGLRPAKHYLPSPKAATGFCPT